MLREVAERAEGACATFRVTAEAPEATAQRFEAGGTAAPDLWPCRTASRRPTGCVGLGDRRRNTRLLDPTTSTVGRVTPMAGLAELDALPAAQRSAALAGIGGMLSRVVPEETLLTAHVRGGEAAVFPTTEQQGQRAAVSGLVAKSAASTTPTLEFPIVTTPSAPPDAAAALTRALTGDAGQAALRDAGFRPPADPTPTIAGGPSPDVVGAAVTPEQAKAAEQVWTAIATPTRLLTVLDTSGSMDQPAAEGEGSRIEVASRAATGAIQPLADHDSVGLWTFSTRQRGDRDWTDCSRWHGWAPTTSGPSWRSRWERCARSSVVTRASTTRSRPPTRLR